MNYDLITFKQVTECRTCSSANLEVVLDLGIQPLANALREENSIENKYPLVLIGCLNCRLLQLSINVNPSLMFKEYLWVTGTSFQARQHCKNFAEKIIEVIQGNSLSLLEIGSNDATLLKEFDKLKRFKSLVGVDPASNINEINSEKYSGINFLSDFFSENFVDLYLNQNSQFDVVVARNVLSHVPDLHDVFRGIKKITTNTADLIIEFHESSSIIRELHYDSIYHEHTYYHDLRSMTYLLNLYGFYTYHVEKSPISGGSYVLFSSKIKKEKSKNILKFEEMEIKSKINDVKTWNDFTNNVRKNINENKYLLKNLTRADSCVYGASARSTTLLNSLDLNDSNFKGIADKNNLKWGKLSPGLGLKIDNPINIIDKNIKNIFITAFNFEEEIKFDLKNNLKWNGTIIIPLPNRPRKYLI